MGRATENALERNRNLRTQDDRYRALVDAMTEGIIVQDPAGRVLTCNPSAARLLGTTPSELLASNPATRPLFQGCFDDDGEIPVARHPNLLTLQTGCPQQGFAMGLRRADESVVWLHVNTHPLPRKSEPSAHDVLISLTDVTERRNALDTLRLSYDELEKAHIELKTVHAQLVQSEKMASIGHLAAGVAHEINNPVGYVNANLGSLSGYIQDFLALIDAYEQAVSVVPPDMPARLQLEQLKSDVDLPFLRDDVRSLLHESQDGITRVKQIVQDLKDFSRVDGAEWQFADVNRGLDSTLNIVWNELKYKCTVSKEYGQVPEIECVPSQLNQVFMNLLVNASQAIAEHGAITIRTGHLPENWVWIAISDTGCGIPRENLSRLFDPFFTTKPVGKGTGLGLSISYGIVTKHGGRIEVESEPGKGTTFTVWLPVHREQVPEETAG